MFSHFQHTQAGALEWRPRFAAVILILILSDQSTVRKILAPLARAHTHTLTHTLTHTHTHTHRLYEWTDTSHAVYVRAHTDPHVKAHKNDCRKEVDTNLARGDNAIIT